MSGETLHQFQTSFVRTVWKNNHKFVTTHTAAGVTLAQSFPHPRSKMHQSAVTFGVTITVIKRFQMVHIENHNTEGLVRIPLGSSGRPGRYQSGDGPQLGTRR